MAKDRYDNAATADGRLATAMSIPIVERSLTKTLAGDRVIPIVDAAVEPLELLLARAAEKNSGYVVTGAMGGSMDKRSWQRALQKAKDAGVTTYSAHFYRHLAASTAIAAGEPIEVVRRMAGHASTQTTETVYRHALMLDQRELAERLSAAVTRLNVENSSEDDGDRAD